MDVRKSLCRVEEIPPSGAIAVHVDSSTGGFDLILVRVGEAVAAYHNECPHAGRRLDYAPGKFLIDAGQLICAAHGATFRIESGHCSGGPCRGAALRSVKVDVIDGQVCLP
ncbi:MAG TPA: Rieske 2Fe-2S domain-containing protein [Rudaea sp.]|jgi:nitrite reductase/ring-hydroxylating ferredoxin subunit|nr:Rieske 2Fe-2S domain-containing protein [Rudaea sp.]